MRFLRVLFLLFLALLLPIRGAVAGAMLCPPGGAPAMHSHANEPHAHGDCAHHAGPAGSVDSVGHAGHAGSCSVCASFCSMIPLLAAMPTLAPSALAYALSFPVLAAPPPTFQSGGQDRPPRSL